MGGKKKKDTSLIWPYVLLFIVIIIAWTCGILVFVHNRESDCDVRETDTVRGSQNHSDNRPRHKRQIFPTSNMIAAPSPNEIRSRHRPSTLSNNTKYISTTNNPPPSNLTKFYPQTRIGPRNTNGTAHSTTVPTFGIPKTSTSPLVSMRRKSSTMGSTTNIIKNVERMPVTSSATTTVMTITRNLNTPASTSNNPVIVFGATTTMHTKPFKDSNINTTLAPTTKKTVRYFLGSSDVTSTTMVPTSTSITTLRTPVSSSGTPGSVTDTPTDNGTRIGRDQATKYIQQAQALNDLYSSAYKKLNKGLQPNKTSGTEEKVLNPLHYDIEIRPNIYTGSPENFTLDGFVRIKLVCRSPTNNITLQANELTITNKTLVLRRDYGLKTPLIVDWEVRNDTQVLSIRLQDMLLRNEIYLLEMNYTAVIGNNNTALPLFTYNNTGTPRYVVSTNFSPIGARNVFPCFDEPGVRSRFSLTIVRRNPARSISGTPLVRIDLRESGWLADVYQTTPTLSTNQLSFTVGDMRVDRVSTSAMVTRLPRTLYPMYYEIELIPHIYEGSVKNFTLEGYMKTQIRCDVPTNNITLHANELNIVAGSVEFWALSGKTPSIIGWKVDKERQLMVIYLSGSLVRGGLYFLKINHTRTLTDKMTGLYLSHYQKNNRTEYLVTTQLKPTFARTVFPCFDEPAMKSYFNITLVRKDHMKSLSNMPVARTERRGGNWVADVYQRTPAMSTYLLSFIIGNIENQNATTITNITYRSWSRPQAVNQTTYYHGIGVDILTYYDHYLGIGLPLQKQDMVAVPDFSANAIGSWGLTVTRETSMLFDLATSSEADRQRITTEAARTFGKQWFGNLVTHAWWNDLWLTECLTTYIGYMGTHFHHPDWKMFEQFVTSETHKAFEQDGLVTSHPLYIPVSQPEEINEVMDPISYSKGASLLRMLEFSLGERTFRDGLRNYLKRHAYGTASHEELWAALAEQSRKDGRTINLKTVMDTWIMQMNYPVVMVTRLGMFHIRVTQQRYLKDPGATDPGQYKSNFRYRWDIPFAYTTSREMRFNKTYSDIIWLNWTTYETVIVDKAILPIHPHDWLLANPRQYGYYRVNYDIRNWKALIRQLKTDHKKIEPINRAQIINDAMNLANSDLMPMEIALQTLEYTNHELDYVPRVAAMKELDFLNLMLPAGLYASFKDFVKSKITGPFQTVGMNNTGATHLESLTRSAIFETACKYGITACIDESKRLYSVWMKHPTVNPIDPDLRETVYCTAIKYGDISQWNFAYSQYKTTTSVAESNRLLAVMGCSREPWVLNRYMDRVLNPSFIQKKDALRVIQNVAIKSSGRRLAWDFFVKNWKKISFKIGGSDLSRLITSLTATFNSPSDLARLQTFTDTHPNQAAGKREFGQALERTMFNIRWMTTKLKAVKQWLISLGFSPKKL